MRERAVEMLALETDLRRAIDGSQFKVHYQPIVELGTQRVVGFEALVRWEHPDRGLVGPNDFIPTAEKTGLIVPIGHYVLREACEQLSEWQRRFPMKPQLVVSVNLSARQFADDALVDRVEEALDETGLDPRSLKLEMTESVIMEHTELASALLWELRNRQVQTYLDDFGTGYSSLSYLHRFPTDTLKIDRSFVASMDQGTRHLEIIRAILGLAGNLGLGVVAEGVETDVQLKQLQALGCALGQGYFFAKPMAPEAVPEFMERATHERSH